MHGPVLQGSSAANMLVWLLASSELDQERCFSLNASTLQS